ncbi:MAG: hypothetical protein ACLGHL_09805 [Actinomycetota bacterium]
MKRVVAVLLTVCVAGALFAAPATAGKKKKKKAGVKQEFVGSVMVPVASPADGACVYRAERTLAIAGGPGGYVGHHFDLDPRTVGQKFELHVTGGSDDVDLDIAFYDGYNNEDDPSTAPSNLAFETREPGGETGVIPPGFSKVIVCMAAGQNAEFHYTTG